MNDKRNKIFQFLPFGLICLLMMLSISSSAEINYMTAQETAARKDRCAQNPKCQKSLEQRKAKMAQRGAKFVLWCEANPGACAERKAEMKRHMVEYSGKCKTNTAECKRLVKQRLSMSRKEARDKHCQKNPQRCAKRKEQRAQRSKRRARRQVWCEANPAQCAGKGSKRNKVRRSAIAGARPGRVE